MGRRKSSARTKSTTPSPAGAPPKKPKTTTLHQFWPSDARPLIPASSLRAKRETPTLLTSTSKFASANPFAPLSDTEEYTPPILRSESPPKKLKNQQHQPPKSKSTISIGHSHPGDPPTPPRVPNLLRPSLRPSVISAPKREVINIPDSSSSSTSSSAPPESTQFLLTPSSPTGSDSATPTSNREFEFVEETPSPGLTPSQQQHLINVARRLRFINDDDDSDSDSRQITTQISSSKPTMKDPPSTTSTSGQDDSLTPPRGNLKNDRSPSEGIPLNASVIAKAMILSSAKPTKLGASATNAAQATLPSVDTTATVHSYQKATGKAKRHSPPSKPTA